MLINEAKKILEDTEQFIVEVNRIPLPIKKMVEALDRYVTATRKRLEEQKAQQPKQQSRPVCKHMQLQDYYASDCAKCRGKAIICSCPEVIENYGAAKRDVCLESKRLSFPMHMSERRCRPENCKYFEAE